MKNLLRTSFAVLVLSFLFQAAPVHAQSTCILGIVCVGGSGSTSTPSDAPEISGDMLTTGLGLVTGVGLMLRNRRRSAK